MSILKQKEAIAEARMAAIKNESDGNRSMAVYMAGHIDGMAQFVMDTLTPQQLMMSPGLIEIASELGVSRSTMGKQRGSLPKSQVLPLARNI